MSSIVQYYSEPLNIVIEMQEEKLTRKRPLSSIKTHSIDEDIITSIGSQDEYVDINWLKVQQPDTPSSFSEGTLEFFSSLATANENNIVFTLRKNFNDEVIAAMPGISEKSS